MAAPNIGQQHHAKIAVLPDFALFVKIQRSGSAIGIGGNRATTGAAGRVLAFLGEQMKLSKSVQPPLGINTSGFLLAIDAHQLAHVNRHHGNDPLAILDRCGSTAIQQKAKIVNQVDVQELAFVPGQAPDRALAVGQGGFQCHRPIFTHTGLTPLVLYAILKLLGVFQQIVEVQPLDLRRFGHNIGLR